MFLVFDGLDGAGKSTQLNLLVDWLTESGHEVVSCKDPGSTPLGERLRELLLNEDGTRISMLAEMMLFTTARTELVQQVVKPALGSGKVVVLDRYILSTVVYQGHAGDLDPDDIRKVNHIATEGLQPDLTFVFDLSVDLAMERLGDSLDRMESRGHEYFGKVRGGFREEAERFPVGVEIVDASRDIESIQSEIRTAVSALIQKSGGTK